MFIEYLGTLSLLLGIVTGMWGLYQIIKGLKEFIFHVKTQSVEVPHEPDHRRPL